MFDIGFIQNEPPYLDEDGWPGLWGQIVLGEFTERFVAPIDWWTRDDYERQWFEGARRLIDGAQESAFVQEAGRLWWTAWREGDDVHIQQRLLVDESLSRARTAGVGELPYEVVGLRATHTDDGQLLSTWIVSIADLRAFVDRSATR
jgi:hypothetical protein